MRGGVLLFGLAACGRVGFDAHPPDAVATADAGLRTIAATGGTSSGFSVAALPDGALVYGGFVFGELGFLGASSSGDPASADGIFGVVGTDGSSRWAKRIATTGPDEVDAIVVTADTIVIGGVFSGDADFGGGMVTAERSDGFLAGYAFDGTLEWFRRVGGNAPNDGQNLSDGVYAIAVAPDGDLLVGGVIRGTVDFGGGAVAQNAGTEVDAYVARYAGDATALRWVKRFGSGGENATFSVAVASDDQVYAGGYINGATSFGGTVSDYGANSNGFIVGLTGAGAWRWDRVSAGTDGDYIGAVALRGTDTLAAAGMFRGVDPEAGTSVGMTDGVIVDVAANTGALNWSYQLGTSGCDGFNGLRVDAAGIVAAGHFAGPLVFAGQAYLADGMDGAIVRLGFDGSERAFTQLGGPGDDAVVWTAPAAVTGVEAGVIDCDVNATAGNLFVTY